MKDSDYINWARRLAKPFDHTGWEGTGGGWIPEDSVANALKEAYERGYAYKAAKEKMEIRIQRKRWLK